MLEPGNAAMHREQPVLWTPKIGTAKTRGLCTDCGVSRTSSPARCATACQFIKPDYPSAETRVHGRTRKLVDSDELYFGVHESMYTASLKKPDEGAQWTGITTRIAANLLADGSVDAVLAVCPDDQDQWKPKPVHFLPPAWF